MINQLSAQSRKTRTVLMIDYFFPPMGGAGAQRTLGYVRNLTEFGWKPIVLTVRAGDGAHHDASLLQRIPREVNVRRTRSLEPIRIAKSLLRRRSNGSGTGTGSPHRLSARALGWATAVESWLFFPDRHIGWVPFAIADAIAADRRDPIDVIYSTSTAYTSHLIAYLLKKIWGKPWVADFQDPWADRQPPYPSRLHQTTARRLERLVLLEADRVIVTTDPLRDMLRRAHTTVKPDKVTVIPMGFTPEAFEGLVPNPRPKFTITHLGNFYDLRSPGPFLTALGECLRKQPRLALEIEVVFFGAFDAALRKLTEELLQRYNLQDIVRLGGIIPYEAGPQHLVSSEVLLLVTDPGWVGQSCIPSKLFEYLAADRPILALTPDGAAAQVVRRANGGMIVEPDNIPAIQDAILKLHQAWREGRLISSVDHGIVARFAWQELTADLATILEDVLPSSPPPALDR